MIDLWNLISPRALAEVVLSSSVLILLLAAIRRLLGHRLSGGLRYGLWLLVVLRLLIPGSLFPAPVTVTEASSGLTARVDTLLEEPVFPAPSGGEVPASPGDPAGSQAGTQTEPQAGGAAESVPAAAAFSWGTLLGGIWLGGAVLTALVLAGTNLSFLRSLRRRRQALPLQAGPLPVYLVPDLPSPCLAGVLRPAVYLNAAAREEGRLPHILTHELVHYRHLDPLWGLVRCLCLTLYWFHPLVWLAAALSRRDSELACDEGVIRRLGEEARISYGETLVAMVAPAPRPAALLQTATTMSGSGRQIRERVRRIVRRPRALVLTALLALALAAAVAVLTFGGGGGEEPARVQKPVDEETARSLRSAVAVQEPERIFPLLPEISWGGYREAAGEEAVQQLLDLLNQDAVENMWQYDESRYTAILGLGSAGLEGDALHSYEALTCRLAAGHPARFGAAAGALEEAIQEEIARCLGALAQEMGGPTPAVSGSDYQRELTDWGMAWMGELRGELTLSLPDRYDDDIFSFPIPDVWRDTVVLRRGTYQDTDPSVPLSYYVTCLSKEVWYAEGDGMGHICTFWLAPTNGELAAILLDLESSSPASVTGQGGQTYQLFASYPTDVQFMTEDQAWLFRYDEAEAILKELAVTPPALEAPEVTARPDTVEPAAAEALTAAVARKSAGEVLELLPQVSLKGYLQAAGPEAAQGLLDFLQSHLSPGDRTWYSPILGLGFADVSGQPLDSRGLLTALATGAPHLFGSTAGSLSRADQEAVSQALAPLADQAGAAPEDRETWGLRWMEELRGERVLSLPERWDDGVFSFPVPEAWRDTVFLQHTTTREEGGGITHTVDCYSKLTWYAYGSGMGYIGTFVLTPAGSARDIGDHHYNATVPLVLADGDGAPYHLYRAAATDVQYIKGDADLFREELLQGILKELTVTFPAL